jgi:hypothetical protein
MLREAAVQRFSLWERHRIHVLPVHYYSPLPDTRDSRHDLRCELSELVGIDMWDEDQIQLLEGFNRDFQSEYDAIPFHKVDEEGTFYLDNDYFRTVDAEILYCMIRRYKPKRVFEIGSGISTLLSAQALLENEREGRCGTLIAFEPYANDFLGSGFPDWMGCAPVRFKMYP